MNGYLDKEKAIKESQAQLNEMEQERKEKVSLA